MSTGINLLQKENSILINFWQVILHCQTGKSVKQSFENVFWNNYDCPPFRAKRPSMPFILPSGNLMDILLKMLLLKHFRVFIYAVHFTGLLKGRDHFLLF